MKNFTISLLVLLSILLGITNTNLLCQDEQFLFESEGTDFWFTFMPNYLGGGGAASNRYDSLYIFITSKFPTKGTIYYNRFTNNGVPVPYEHEFQITQPNQIYKFSVTHSGTALQGFNKGGAPGSITSSLDSTDCEVIRTKTFHIVTEEKSTVYALDYAYTSAEAFIVLPITAIGKEYYVLTYNSDGTRVGWNPDIGGSSTPSQFAIVAAYDNTNIKISPKVSTVKFGMQEQNIVLNQGEAYLVQAKITADSLRNDLSGTKITADKEIAVFAGHQRATVPIDNISSSSSRDNLIEQLIPIHSWGKNAIITPFAQPSKSALPIFNPYSDIFRVIAAKDETNIWINDVIVATLNEGEFYQNTLIPALIKADKPIMVAQYKRTENFAGESGTNSDPLMLIVPPTEQFKSDYNFINPQIYGGNNNGAIFDDQYITIIAPDTAIDKVFLDGMLLSKSIFISIRNTGFSYTTRRVTDGGHNVNCVAPIAVLIYGYGYAVSYGYLGGMSFKDLERDKIAMMVDTCNSTATFIFNETFNSGIKSYQILENINCEFDEEVNTKWQLKLNIRKNDANKKSIFSISIFDIYDVETIFTDTMTTNSFILKDLPQSQILDFPNCKISSLNSSGFYIVNNGDETITFDKENFLMYNNINFTVGKSNFPITLAAGDSAYINIFYSPTGIKKKTGGKDFDTLLLSSKCNYYMIFLEGEPIADTLDISSRCGVPIRIVADSILRNYAIPQIVPNPVYVDEFKYHFSITAESMVQINLYNSLGELVEVIFSDFLDAGNYEIEISTNKLPQGLYFIKLSTSSTTHLNQLLLTK